MADLWSRPGIGHVGSYQAAGYPWLTGSALAGGGAELQVQFPYVAKYLKITSRGVGEVNIHFQSTGAGNVIAGNHFWLLSGSGDSVELPCKCDEVWISSPGDATEFDLFAELTSIGTEQMPILTGSGHTD